MIKNPILPGFNPDPSFCRVGEDYYIATSTFEWYPGVQIHHSRDLVNWELVSRPLNRGEQLDMRGNPDSCGIWAPCLSYEDGKFWLVYTDVKRLEGSFKDSHNYIVTCDTIDGEWSDRIYVNSSGFDPSLFHDDDGRKWFMNMLWNHRQEGTGCNPAHNRFDGIVLQEWSETKGLFGPVKNIYGGTARGLTEGAHIFKRNGYYYLTTAEGGTGYDHAVSLSRSRQIDGPYEDHPDLHVICAALTPDLPIQRTGHGQYVETHDGQFYHTFLMGRPLPGFASGTFCAMGRETGIERCVWKDDWLYLEQGGLAPRVEIPMDKTEPKALVAIERTFTAGALPMEFQWLRTPEPDRIFSLKDQGLELIGRESIGSWFEQALVARRQEHSQYSAITKMEFEPDVYQQSAGLTTYYNRTKFHALMVSCDPVKGRSLTIMSCPGTWPSGELSHPLAEPQSIPDGAVELRVDVSGPVQQFYWRRDGGWNKIGPELDASVISDEGGAGEHASFTGAFVGMLASDQTGQGKTALFKHFSYDPT
jgi:xylan 1,4-beta-xylosidase